MKTKIMLNYEMQDVSQQLRLVQITSFVKESNHIEGIIREPTNAEIEEMVRFLELESVTIGELERFLKVYQPDAIIRSRVGLDVRVGGHIPPRGCPEIVDRLIELLERANLMPQSAYQHHIEYETLHPFTDGNGRSGRALWAWQMKSFPIGFLRKFYYQTLGSNR